MVSIAAPLALLKKNRPLWLKLRYRYRQLRHNPESIRRYRQRKRHGCAKHGQPAESCCFHVMPLSRSAFAEVARSF